MSTFTESLKAVFSAYNPWFICTNCNKYCPNSCLDKESFRDAKQEQCRHLEKYPSSSEHATVFLRIPCVPWLLLAALYILWAIAQLILVLFMSIVGVMCCGVIFCEVGEDIRNTIKYDAIYLFHYSKRATLLLIGSLWPIGPLLFCMC